MLGAQISEGRGKRTGRRVLATNPVTVEASVEEMTTVRGISGLAIITYTSSIKPDGSLDGEGDGVFASLEGDIVTFKGIGVGRFGEGGSVHYTGSLSYTTSSPKLAALNGVSGAFEWDIDADGNTHSNVWEMASASQRAGA